LNNLASTLGDQGQLEEAAKWKKEVLEKRRRILGEEHPDTITAMNNLASTLGDQGQLEEAAQMKKEVLEKMWRILGEEDPDTISAMSNLASTLGDQGQLEEAAQMKKEVLEKRRRILGEEDPDTISAMNNLALTLGEQGQLEEAAKMKKEVLEKRRRILGEEHPDTITAMNTRLFQARERETCWKLLSRHEVFTLMEMWFTPFRGQVLFYTSSGYLGIGSKYVRPGDHIYLVAGAKVPYLFRHVANQPVNHFELVGETYIDPLLFKIDPEEENGSTLLSESTLLARLLEVGRQVSEVEVSRAAGERDNANEGGDNVTVRRFEFKPIYVY
jgi:hypothetical protein